MRRYYCTCFDHNYLIYGMTLFDSLAEHGGDFILYVLALSDECFTRLIGADPRIVPIRLGELEEFDPELRRCRDNRSRTEYIFTMSPCLPLFLFAKYPGIDLLTSLDSDLFFFESPECLYGELGDRSLFIIEHRFSDGYRQRSALNGRFNVACQIYRNDETAIACLKQWRRQCLAWCRDKAEDGKFADQKYLDSWPEEFGDRVVISRNPGADLAPWNMDNYSLAETEGKFTVDRENVVFVHYQAFKVLGKHIFVWYNWSRKKSTRPIFHRLAHTYFSALRRTATRHAQLFAGLANFYPNRGAFFSPKLEALLKFVPFAPLRHFFRILYVLIFYRRHVYFQ